MKKIALYLYSVCIFFSGCGNRNKQVVIEEIKTDEIEYTDSGQIYFFDYENLVKNTKSDTFTINSIAKNISFIIFETTKEALFALQYIKFAKINEYYYISWSKGRDFNSIMVFDSTGLFVNNLVQRGQGPKELPMMNNWSYNHNTQLLLASSFHQMLLHSFENNVTNKYNLVHIGRLSSFYPSLLNDGTIVDIPDWIGTGDTDTPYLNFRNQEGEIIKSVYYTQKRDMDYIDKIPEGGGGLVSTYEFYPQIGRAHV
jgi:hypothetical protein